MIIFQELILSILDYLTLHVLVLNSGQSTIVDHPIAYLLSFSQLSLLKNKDSGSINCRFSFGVVFKAEV